ncbi:MAG: hypothetical protein KHZ79_07275 [Atopobium minutum]|uniref:hypothetical protein n=1 Tax=Atopobium minutum TaxID=1381 RepID=UPI001D2ACA87|nr:hypothetical protein [Atopobium minutum]MBS4874158.1 hypothetical protein [Atopobium minutum]
MKFSKIPADRAFDVLADISVPLANIASDKKLIKALQGFQGDDIQAAKVAKAVGLIAKEHKDDLYTILAVTEGQSVEEYLAGRSAARVIVDAIELLSDDKLTSFLATPATEVLALA